MEISNTGITDQDLKSLRRYYLQPKSSLSDFVFFQRSDTIDQLIDLNALTDEVNQETRRFLGEETKERSSVLTMIAESIRSVEDRLFKSIRILGNEDEEHVEFQEAVGEEGGERQQTEEKERRFWEGRMYAAVKLAEEVESKIKSYVESSEKEKREIERRVVSLTEENRDINGLLRAALSEKEAAEKKLKGMNEQKRLALLQIAERGLQRVGLGFGFGFGSGSGSVENVGNKCKQKEEEEEEEEEDSVVKTVEKTMKNLRHEISQLRSSLDETMSDNERLRRLAGKQARKLEENAACINEMEKREKLLAQNVEELMMEIREAEAEVSRWREACELEVKAGRLEVEELNRVISILKAELEKARSALAKSEGKLKLKEELARAAMAAEEAAEKSLRLADRRAAELLGRTEQLTRQLEEAEAVERSSRRKLRHRLCWPSWPWRAVTAAAATTTAIRYVRRSDEIIRGPSLPAESRALLRHGT